MKCIWSPHPGPQTAALAVEDSVFEINFGGSRGGGKTAAGIAWLLKGTVDPGFTGLVIRRNHSDLRQWIEEAKQIYVHAKVTGKPSVFEFKNGSKILYSISTLPAMPSLRSSREPEVFLLKDNDG